MYTNFTLQQNPICTIGYSVLKRYQKHVNKIPNIEY
ncbi:SE2200 family small protein [Staphylococcus caprae]|nr:SE2200 family small protein [Staphylococcus caprae]